MGQRFQVFISTPPYVINANNPNNTQREWRIYHCQWMYGATAVHFALDLINAFGQLRRKHDPSIIKDFDWAGCVESAVQRAATVHFPNTSRLTSYNQTSPQNNWICNKPTWEAVFNSCDNNNGFLFIYITPQEKIEYCFWNQENTENALHHDEPLTAQKYLDGYYTKVQQEEIGADKVLQKLEVVKLFTAISSTSKPADFVIPMEKCGYTATAITRFYQVNAKNEKTGEKQVKGKINKICKEKNPAQNFHISLDQTYTWEGIAWSRGK